MYIAIIPRPNDPITSHFKLWLYVRTGGLIVVVRPAVVSDPLFCRFQSRYCWAGQYLRPLRELPEHVCTFVRVYGFNRPCWLVYWDWDRLSSRKTTLTREPVPTHRVLENSLEAQYVLGGVYKDQVKTNLCHCTASVT